jgi:hypothetical protein
VGMSDSGRQGLTLWSHATGETRRAGTSLTSQANRAGRRFVSPARRISQALRSQRNGSSVQSDGVTDVELAWDDAPYAITHGERVDLSDRGIRVVVTAGHAAARRHSVRAG